jgi:nucleoside-specific outer membrane channel protein Tsx
MFSVTNEDGTKVTRSGPEMLGGTFTEEEFFSHYDMFEFYGFENQYSRGSTVNDETLNAHSYWTREDVDCVVDGYLSADMSGDIISPHRYALVINCSENE